DWGLYLSCGQTNQGTLNSTDSLDFVVSGKETRYADYFFFNAQAGTAIALNYNQNSTNELIFVLMGSSNEVIDFTVGTNGGLIESIPYSGIYLAELTTLETNFMLGPSYPYALSLTCG